MSEEMIEAMDKYNAEFGEKFPLMNFMGVDEDEIISEIEAHLKSGKPYVGPEGVIF